MPNAATTVSSAACPLCGSSHVHQAGAAMDLVVFACDDCNAQFTVQLPRKRQPASTSSH